VDGYRTMSLLKEADTGAGNLHGVWFSDFIVHISDRKLKTNIQPLAKTLNMVAAKGGAGELFTSSGAAAAAAAGEAGEGARWVLRELRPVSYHFKRGPESKLQRFGFIADEVMETLPQVIREHKGQDPSGPDQVKGILYEDLIAVLAVAMQAMQHQLEGTDSTARSARSRLDAVEARLERLEEAFERHAESVELSLRSLEATVLNSLRLPELRASRRLLRTQRSSGARTFGSRQREGLDDFMRSRQREGLDDFIRSRQREGLADFIGSRQREGLDDFMDVREASDEHDDLYDV